MKSFFLLTFLVALVCNEVWAQTPASTIYNARLVNNEKRDFKNFYDRLRIGYFGVPTTPHFGDMESGKWHNAATSPQWGKDTEGEGKNQDTVPFNIWNQISFNYNFGAKLNFVVNPRWTTPLATATDNPIDRSLIALEDMLVGFQGVIVSSEDKKLNIWIRAGLRLPTSRASRVSDNGGFGRITYQPELAYNPTYDFNKKWQLGIFGQFRSWVYEERYNLSRFRFYTAPYIQYTINDTTRFQWYFQSMVENFRRHKDINNLEPQFRNYYQDFMIGLNKDVTPKLNLFPYLGVFIQDKPFDRGTRDFHQVAINNKAFYIGAWISYQIK